MNNVSSTRKLDDITVNFFYILCSKNVFLVTLTIKVRGGRCQYQSFNHFMQAAARGTCGRDLLSQPSRVICHEMNGYGWIYG